jgi:hypothetical protein
MNSPAFINPFGFNASEKELEVLPELFLADTEFHKKAMDPLSSVVIGRRGTGKTALAHYYRFGKASYDIYVDVDEPAVFSKVLEQLSKSMSNSMTIVEDITKLWELSLWTSLMVEICRDGGNTLDGRKAAIDLYLRKIGVRPDTASQVMRAVLEGVAKLASPVGGNAVELVYRIQDILTSPEFTGAKLSVLKILERGQRAVIVIDTLEQFQVRKSEMQYALGGMLQAVTRLALGTEHKNLHVKCFLPAEIFPYLVTSAVQNIAKTLEFPVYLHWRPKELLRLATKRIHSYMLAEHPKLARSVGEVDMSDAREVRNRVWAKYFPDKVTTRSGMEEDSFQYIVRHTQLRPRQVIWLCNAIAQNALDRGVFPRIEAQDIVQGVEKVEESLAAEVLNGYQTVYPGIQQIMASFRGQPNLLDTSSRLDQLASRTKNAWPVEFINYDRYVFGQMACEVGIVGAVEGMTDRVIAAEFEYSRKEPLHLNWDEPCAIHPLFYRYFRIKVRSDRIVYPLGPDVHANDFNHVAVGGGPRRRSTDA